MEVEERDFIDLVQCYARLRKDSLVVYKTDEIIKKITKKYNIDVIL